MKLTNFEELANESCVLKAGAGQLKDSCGHMQPAEEPGGTFLLCFPGRWLRLACTVRPCPQMTWVCSGITVRKDAFRKPARGRLLRAQPTAPLASFLVPLVPREDRAQCRAHEFLRQQPRRRSSLGRRNDSTTRPWALPVTCSPPQSHPAPPAWSGPSQTSQMWPPRLCLNRMGSCHTGGFPLSPILPKEGICHFTLHHE